MIKDAKKFECKLGDKLYEFYCDSDSPIGHVKEALFQFIKLVGQVEENILAQQKTADAAKEENKESCDMVSQ